MRNLKAFSLIEVSAAILIIGILLVGTVVSNNLVDRFRLASAESLTKSSPITTY